jgi:hypothetical protein
MAFLLLVVAFVLIIVLFGGETWSRIWRVQRKRRMARLQRYNPRNILRSFRRQAVYQVDLPTVRDFILTLQLSLSLAETLAGALQQASRQFGVRGVFGERLQKRVRSQLQVEPEQVIRALSEDFQDRHLSELADRLDLAHEGGLTYSEAVAASLEDVEEEIRVNVEKEIERAPVTLSIPMIIGVFFSALALLGWPLLMLMFGQVLGATGTGVSVP